MFEGIPIHIQDTGKCKRLFQSILLQQLQDFFSNNKTDDGRTLRMQAHHWLHISNPDFREICEGAGINPVYAHERFIWAKTKGNIT